MSHESEWWRSAVALESQDRLEEAEKVINEAVLHLGAAASVAELYALRMDRMLQAQDTVGALDAFRRADRWIAFYAAQATSGGEGAALSRERDQFRRSLVASLGYDPERQ